jgi:hypothetical protein
MGIEEAGGIGIEEAGRVGVEAGEEGVEPEGGVE